MHDLRINMAQIIFGKKQIRYKIKRGKRVKTAAITVTPDARIVVAVPSFLNKKDVEKFVRKKARWIFEKQEYFKALSSLYPEKEFISGEQILYLGRRYRLKVKHSHSDGSGKLKLIGRRMFVFVGNDLNKKEKKSVIRDAIKNWYISRAKIVIRKRVNQFCKFLNVGPEEIIIKTQKKRWGSCSRDGTLRFNWRVVIAPMSIIDYIVVHELCHLKVKNHSAEFWRLVSLALPDYQRRRDWLKNNVGIFRL